MRKLTKAQSQHLQKLREEANRASDLFVTMCADPSVSIDKILAYSAKAVLCRNMVLASMEMFFEKGEVEMLALKFGFPQEFRNSLIALVEDFNSSDAEILATVAKLREALAVQRAKWDKD